MSKVQTFHPFLFWYLLFFFLNSIFLPEGLLYTSLFSPFILYWLIRHLAFGSMLKWGALLVLPLPVHYMQGVETTSFLISTMLLLSAWIFLFGGLEFVKQSQAFIDQIFVRVLNLNVILTFGAIIVLPFGLLNTFVWDFTPISPGVPVIPRLMLFAYEPSHYGLLLTPVYLFFIWKVITGHSKTPVLTLLAVFIPLVLSLSFGIIAGIFLAVCFAMIVHIKDFSNVARIRFVTGISLLAIGLAFILFLFPENPVSLRVSNILEGRDTSARGRLLDAFMFAKDLAIRYNVFLGVGPGQIKILAHDMIVNFYQYEGEYAAVMRIPNSVAETLATFGLYGFLLKIFVPLYFFFKLKVYNNLYALSLFVFIFIYQFTGSFLGNAAEIGVWIFVFAMRINIFELPKKSAE